MVLPFGLENLGQRKWSKIMNLDPKAKIIGLHHLLILYKLLKFGIFGSKRFGFLLIAKSYVFAKR